MSIVENRYIETLSTARPTLIGQTGPKRSESLPATGATTAMTRVVGRKRIPASSAP